jgi:poly-gamma-glutamate capsule biosynthesis protein CapA/YwtB (metallophosphatase superfamily)
VTRLRPSRRRGPARTRALAAAAVVLALLSACGGPAVTPRFRPAPAPTGVASAASGPAQITLAFAGDVHFTGRTSALLDNPATAFGPIAEVLSAADVAMVNLESAVTTRGTEEPKRFHFRAPSIAYAAVMAAGVDVVSIGNNHALDYGRVGLADTLAAAAAAGMPTVGAGADAAEAYRPWITTVKGTRIAYLGFSQIAELATTWAAKDDRSGIAMAFDTARATAAVKAARQAADVVVVYMHWGNEGQQCPSGPQRSFAKLMAEAGATMVVGTHAHLLLGEGFQGATFVQYGLGNFVWYHDDAWSNDTGVLQVTLLGNKVTKTELVPAMVSRTTGQPIPATGTQAARITKKYADLHKCTGLAAAASPSG